MEPPEDAAAHPLLAGPARVALPAARRAAARVVRAVLLALLAAHVAVPVARAQDATESAHLETLRDVYDDARIQRDLPEADDDLPSRLDPHERSPFERSSRRTGNGSGEATDGSGELPAPDERTPFDPAQGAPGALPAAGGQAASALLGTIGLVLFWGVIAVIVIAVLVAVYRFIRDRPEPSGSEGKDVSAGEPASDDADGFAPPAARPGTRDRAVALAAAGDPLGAAHLLLLDALARCARDGRPLQRATTAREFLQLLPADGEERPCVDVLVRTVERGLFAVRPLEPTDVGAALAAYDRLLALDGRAA